METVRKTIELLLPRERIYLAILMVMMAIHAFLELITISSISPFLFVVADPANIQKVESLSWVYDRLEFADSNAFLIFLASVSLGALLVTNAFSILKLWAQTRFIQGLAFSLSMRFLGHFLHQPYEYFLDRNSAQIGRTVLAEVTHMVSQVISPLLNIAASLMLTLGITGLLIYIDPKVAILSAVVLGCSYGLIYGLVRKHLLRLGTEKLAANKRRFQTALEAFGGIKDVKILGKEKAMLSLYRAPARQLTRIGVRAALLQSIPSMLLQVLAFGGIFTIAILTLIANNGDLSKVLPVLGVFAFAGFRLLPRLRSIFDAFAKVRFGTAVVDSLYKEMSDSSSNSRPVHGGKGVMPQLDLLGESLDLKDVTYIYPSAEQPSLRNISLTIPANNTIGIIGPTGCGKTTLADVVLGLLVPNQGEIRVDGRLLDLSLLPSWMKQIGYVPQHIFLTDDTVTRNIAFGEKLSEIDHKAVRWAAGIANIDDFITQELPQGYDTKVGERGIRLSGGQRQRIGIARALYRNPSLLLLDEATSALDNDTEAAVMAAIRNLIGTRTMIIIAHRLTTLSCCSNIIELRDGRIIRNGTYSELFGAVDTTDVTPKVNFPLMT